jgi:hypothetical protein
VAGVAPYIISASQNGWLQSVGPCAVLNKGVTIVGGSVGSPGSVAGGVVIFTTGATGATCYVGEIMCTGVDASSNLVNLRIA